MSIPSTWKILKIIYLAPARDRVKIWGLFRLYRRLDRETARFRRQSGIHCAVGCGRCCTTPDIEATVLDMLPLAVDLWSRKQAGRMLDNIAAQEIDRTCIFYQPDPLIPGQGRCSVYAWRPLVCRLFGFSAKMDKQNKKTFVTCSTIKSLHPQKYDHVQRQIRQNTVAGSRAKQLAIPTMTDFVSQLAGLDPGIGQRSLPINLAMKEALHKVGIYYAARRRK